MRLINVHIAYVLLQIHNDIIRTSVNNRIRQTNYLQITLIIRSHINNSFTNAKGAIKEFFILTGQLVNTLKPLTINIYIVRAFYDIQKIFRETLNN
ncbi:hypothetical protein SAMN05444506_1151 [Pseudomonas syringae]|nr:hypothetical protein SAMN05444506_1151 [Pseudomonas syringae]